MSSHHFVREGQEPALFISDPSSLTLAEPLLEWAPVVIVSDNALPDVLKWKIKIDVILIRQDAARVDVERIVRQEPIEFLYYQEVDDIPNVVVAFLKQRKCRGLNILAHASPGIFDRWMLNVNELEISIIDASTKWSAIQSTFQKWLPKKTKLTVHSPRKAFLNVTGLMRDTDQSFLTESDGIISLQSDEPFWLGELLEG